MKSTMMIACLAAALATGAHPAETAAQQQGPSAAGIVIAESELCTAVSERQPVGSKASPAEFEASVGRVYFWNLAKIPVPPGAIRHVWHLDGKPVAEVVLALKHPRTRTWSSKAVGPGAWKVEAVSEGGQILAAAEFSVR